LSQKPITALTRLWFSVLSGLRQPTHYLLVDAERLVRDARPRIEAIADTLVQKVHLDADEIYELATRAQRIRPAAPHEYVGEVRIIGGQTVR
jgi:hypothetical protein